MEESLAPHWSPQNDGSKVYAYEVEAAAFAAALTLLVYMQQTVRVFPRHAQHALDIRIHTFDMRFLSRIPYAGTAT